MSSNRLKDRHIRVRFRKLSGMKPMKQLMFRGRGRKIEREWVGVGVWVKDENHLQKTQVEFLFLQFLSHSLRLRWCFLCQEELIFQLFFDTSKLSFVFAPLLIEFIIMIVFRSFLFRSALFLQFLHPMHHIFGMHQRVFVSTKVSF
jgi:hypothetical protein